MRLVTAAALCALLALALAAHSATATQVLSRLRDAAANAQIGRRSFPAMSMGSTALPDPLVTDPKKTAVLHPTILQDSTPAVKLTEQPTPPPAPTPAPFIPPPVPAMQPQQPLPKTGQSESPPPCPEMECIGSSITRIVSSFDADERAAAKQERAMQEFRRSLRRIPKGFNDELRAASSTINRASTLRAVTDKFVQDATTRMYNIIRKADKVKCQSLKVARSALKQVVRAMPSATSLLRRPESLPPPKVNQSPSFSSGFRFRSLNPNEVVFHVRGDRTPVAVEEEDAGDQEFSALAAAFPAAAEQNDPDCQDNDE